MKALEVKPNIYWVGGIDWDIRSFHGYVTQRGTTYNAYLIMDEKVTLIDTVKSYMVPEMLERIRDIIDPSKIDYIISNHVEMDHSGGLPAMKEIASNAEVFTSVQGEKGLKKHYKDELNLHVVKTGDTLELGKHTLHFVQVPMVHWPDSMVSYCPETKLLFSNDAFGQHIASAERFDDQLEWGIIHEEAAKYYANIVTPFGDQVKKALEAVGKLEIEMICPSHGIIWRTGIADIIDEYKKWSNYESDKRAVIVYDSMWGSTKQIAYALYEGLESVGIPVSIRDLKSSHISDIITDVHFSKAVLVGSPTLNRGMLPTMAAFLNYFKGLKFRNRIGYAFGSYGWSGESVEDMEKEMEAAGVELFESGEKIQYRPGEEDLLKFKETGKKMGESL
ncbi:FprA family A-type flavoprotein [bacterium]|nr:FprA family A-type flavoprotein [bacterium]